MEKFFICAEKKKQSYSAHGSVSPHPSSFGATRLTEENTTA